MSRIQALRDAGVSVWIDMLSRDVLEDGQFERWIREEGVTGATSNPTIFAASLAAPSDRYRDDIIRLLEEGCADPRQAFLALAVADVGRAADLLRPVYEATDGCDGFVSIECTPDVADDTEATIEQALDVWGRLQRPNVMVKVPATPAGVPAVVELIARGVNINITLLFSRSRYAEIMEAYQEGLQRRLASGEEVRGVRSVASFFVSRIDTKVDQRLPEASPLRGRVAIANAKLAYQMFTERFAGDRWRRLAAAGAQPQRLLWASTGSKNPDYSDVLYIEELIGPAVINTMPPKTLAAFADHGVTRRTLDADLDRAGDVLEQLASEGVKLDEITSQLETEGVASFCASYEELLATIQSKLDEVAAQEAHPA